MRHAFAVGLACATLSLAGCVAGLDDPLVCTTDLRPGLAITVRDSVTRAPAAAGTTLLIVEGAYRDSMSVALDSAVFGAYERSGTYQLTLHHAGYRDWTRSGVSVVSGTCHVLTTNLTALLQR